MVLATAGTSPPCWAPLIAFIPTKLHPHSRPSFLSHCLARTSLPHPMVLSSSFRIVLFCKSDACFIFLCQGQAPCSPLVFREAPPAPTDLLQGLTALRAGTHAPAPPRNEPLCGPWMPSGARVLN